MKRLFSIVLVLLLAAQPLLASTLPVNETSHTLPRVVPIKISQQRPTGTPPMQTQSSFKQDTVKNSDLSLGGQYRFMLSRSKTINGYKLINPYRLSAFLKSVTDTLSKEREELSNFKKETAEQTEKIAGLQSAVKESVSSVSDNNAKINEISFAGMTFSKNTYNIIVWSVIALLTLALFLVIKRADQNVAEVKDKNELYDELSAEYHSFKTKAKEKERKLARELQDERNILEEMKQNGKK